MTDSPLATDPRHSFSVLASAGTGKTWQLVARLTRLLLSGAPADSILAITFTRKAAGEMQQRLGERLEALLEADDATLAKMLREIGESADADTCARARNLLESWLRSEHKLRTTTFHSFCQELLQRFPLEAGLPPAFELTEVTELLVDESWDALFAEATRLPDSPPARAIDQLFEALGSLYSTRSALQQFIHHRSDWWAWTRDADNPVDYATQALSAQLEIDRQDALLEAFWNETTRAQLADFSRLLGQHATPTNTRHVAQLEPCLVGPDIAGSLPEAENALEQARAVAAQIMPVFLTTTFSPRKRSQSAALQKSLGADGAQRFIELHTLFCERLLAFIDAENRKRTFRVNRAWYLAGQRMLEHFQRIKRERRLLDFADLEWKTFRLLNDPEHAHWIQFKLDQRIDHLLIDEFQDTNPTQWQMILPLLEEMAAGGERRRSLFVVGDRKQSIYRFRRGNPALLDRAADWMREHLEARSIRLDASRRSSPAIMEAVNRVFDTPDMQSLMPGFQAHTTHLEDAWGRVEVWPLVTSEDSAAEDAATDELRNPLDQPRADARDLRFYREGQKIAARIEQLVEDKIAGYGDVLILMRSRTHLADYEAALRERGIPYLSRDRGTLLESLEIRDMEALLTVLMTPQDNLALAQVLCSPLFSLDENLLGQLSRPAGGVWLERLLVLAQAPDSTPAVQRAARLLAQWRALAGRIPIHDLLEQIFHQANLLQRYRAAAPESLAAQIEANLSRFVELALEVDSGRYPTLPRFLDQVKRLRGLDKEGLSKATPEAAQRQRVNLLTIHAAKGLEAPVVFLCDTTSQGKPSGVSTLVRWPADADRPTDFLLPGNSAQQDSVTASRRQLEQLEDTRESANLLYVALTRARNMLVVSGCQPTRGNNLGWYGQIATALCETTQLESPWESAYGEPEQKPDETPRREAPATLDVDPRLQQPVPVKRRWREISPSGKVDDSGRHGGDAQGRTRGTIIHRLLQLATEAGAATDAIAARVARETGLSDDDSLLAECYREVCALLEHPELDWVFDAGATCFNEVPLQYRQEDRTVYGIVDRLLVSGDEVHVIDYKSHRVTESGQLDALVEHYRPQLALYREAAARLWPKHRVHCHLLFTFSATLRTVD